MFKYCIATKPWWFSEDIEQIKRNTKIKEFNNKLESNLNSKEKSSRIKL